MTAIWMVVYPSAALLFGYGTGMPFGIFIGTMLGAVGMALVNP